MKKLLVIFFLLPVIVKGGVIDSYISEILIDSLDWKIEIALSSFSVLDDFYIKTSTDSVNFKKGIKYYPLMVVTNDFLERDIKLNVLHDTVIIGFGKAHYCYLRYGPNGVGVPHRGHTLCFRQVDPYFGNSIYYQDATPTLGAFNDTLNITGKANIKVVNQKGEAYEGIRLDFYEVTTVMSEFIPRSLYTDVDGSISLNSVERSFTMYFYKDDKEVKKEKIVIYADTTTDYTIVIDDPNIGNLKEKNIIPSSFIVSQNYPNPFNPETNIMFSIPETGALKVSVYDITGRLVEKLADGEYKPGTYTVTFHSKNNASGIYYLRALFTPLSNPAGAIQEIKKMLLIK